jgi:hypothetical protein
MTFDITDGDGEGKEVDIIQAIPSDTDEWEKDEVGAGRQPPAMNLDPIGLAARPRRRVETGKPGI